MSVSAYTILPNNQFVSTAALSVDGAITANGSFTAPKISANSIDIDGVSLKDTLVKIQERLAILVPDPKLLAKYAALQEAYDHYKTLERLCQGTD